MGRLENRKKTEHFKKSCAGKIKHVSENAAEFYLDYVGDKQSEIYKCPFCKNYHTSIKEE